ncbi:MAG: DUF3006 domain-containing protein [Firmicutes bacterium]|nr:DUF3006 domain-containing protein [Bacillota bacterium]
MRVIIDRFEGEFALVELENGSVVPMSAQLLPGAREGDVVEIKIDRAETARRRQLIEELRQKVARREGDEENKD